MFYHLNPNEFLFKIIELENCQFLPDVPSTPWKFAKELKTRNDSKKNIEDEELRD